MPITDWSKYPKNWKDIATAVKERANWTCEFCGVKHGARGARDIDNVWHDIDSIDSYNSSYGDALFGDYPKIIEIVVTAAHLGIDKPDGTPGDHEDKFDVRSENLKALCQKCHLNYDRPGNIVKRKETMFLKKHKKRREVGQSPLSGFPMDLEM